MASGQIATRRRARWSSSAAARWGRRCCADGSRRVRRRVFWSSSRKAAARDLPAAAGVSWYRSPEELPATPAPDAVVFAVKPQVIDAVLPGYRRWARPQTLFVSIVAGKTIAGMTRHLGPASLIRTMPNTPAAIGRGITVACANERVTAEQRRLCDRLLAAVGESAWVEDEALLDAVTAVSGSGPAYVFLLIEALAEAGEAVGSAARPRFAPRAQHRRRVGRIGAALGREPGAAARECDEPRRHHARRARRVDGEGRTGAADQASGRGRGGALARTGELSMAQEQPQQWRSRGAVATKRSAAASEADRIIDAALRQNLDRGVAAAVACRGRGRRGTADPAGLSQFPVEAGDPVRLFPADRRGGSRRAAGARGRRTAARPAVRSVDAAIRRASALQIRDRGAAPRAAGAIPRRCLSPGRRCCARCAGCSKRPASRPAGSEARLR